MSGLVESSADARSKLIGQNFRCRAWVNFNGSNTVAIRGSGNVSSITDNGTGNYVVNFTTPMEDGNYSATINQPPFQYTSGSKQILIHVEGTSVFSGSSIGIRVGTISEGTLGGYRDLNVICVSIFR